MEYANGVWNIVTGWNDGNDVCSSIRQVEPVGLASELIAPPIDGAAPAPSAVVAPRSEEHTSELQSLMRISYAVFCLKKKKKVTKRKVTESQKRHLIQTSRIPGCHNRHAMIKYDKLQEL